MTGISKTSGVKPVLVQAQNNTTNWIGHLLLDPVDHFAGQTFYCPADGELDNIQVYTNLVQEPGELELTLFEFDATNKKWGDKIGTASVTLAKDDGGAWKRFHFDPALLKKGRTYGFKIKTNNAFVAIGEAATGNHSPFLFGQEWVADSTNVEGKFFTYFNLAFKVEMRA